TQARDDPITLREMGSPRRASQGKLADQRALLFDGFAQVGVTVRVNDVHAAAEHGESDSLRRQSPAVRARVDALCEPAGDRQPAHRKVPRELEGGIAALGCGV